MKDIFGPSRPIEESSNTWRSIIAVLVLLFAAGSTFFFFSGRSIELTEASSVAALFPFDNLRQSTAGGDIIVEPPPPPKPKLPELVGDALDVSEMSAEAIMIKDVESGMVLFENGAYTQRPIASLTKLMSALVVLEKTPEWVTSTQVVPDDIIDTHMYAGDTYTLEELWKASLIGSSNKAILTLADAVGWPRAAFVERMNQLAREIGMSDTFFVEQTGLEEGNVSTPSDLLLLLDEVLEKQEIQQTLRTAELNLYSNERKKKHHMWNTNWLLLGWIPNTFGDQFLGGKTGYIPESGYNFMMRVSDGKGHEVDVVVLGTNSHEARFTEARDVAYWAMENYQWPDEIEPDTE